MKILVTGTYISHRLKCHRAIFALPFFALANTFAHYLNSPKNSCN